MAGGKARLPPRWFVVTAWTCTDGSFEQVGGKGLWPRARKVGALRLTARGRRSGKPRSVILGYCEDGDNLSLDLGSRG
jgi:F420H(2)-dependent quinone reductase